MNLHILLNYLMSSVSTDSGTSRSDKEPTGASKRLTATVHTHTDKQWRRRCHWGGMEQHVAAEGNGRSHGETGGVGVTPLAEMDGHKKKRRRLFFLIPTISLGDHDGPTALP